ncbi:MAG: hypothetical protein R3F60_18840 [bacterium]
MAPGTDEIPCEIEQILTPRCGTCHSEALRFGAPIRLDDLATLRGPALSDRARPLHTLLAERMEHATRPMPPPPNPLAPPAEIEAIRAWSDAGAPAGAACGAEPDPPPDVDPTPPPPALDCEYDLELKAHGGFFAEDEAPFHVPLETDHYECFYFRPPWDGDVHGLSFAPIVDDDRVLHHWLLYVQEGAGFGDGDHDPCVGRHDNAELVAGWAPGGGENVMPPDVGLHLPGNRSHLFVLEIHYNNQAGHADALDRSGVRLCATSTRRPNTAGMHWLGTENLLMVFAGSHDRTGTCRPRLNSPVNILSSTPHMHRRGRHLKTEIVRANGGGREILIDAPFDFENQVLHDTPATVYPGDTLETTCTFEHEGGIIGFGPGTNDEMCYNFVVAWPYGALSTGGSLTNAENACLR